MCGRFGIIEEVDWSLLNVETPQTGLPLNVDIRPTNAIACVLQENGVRTVRAFPWGLKPSWSRRVLINARAETVAQKSTFSGAFRSRRCLIPMHGWYEWADDGSGTRCRYWFHAYDRRQLAMAGLWYPRSEQHPDGAVVSLTVPPNDDCAPYHDRMPLLMPKAGYDDWLNPQSDRQQLASLMVPPPERLIRVQAGLPPLAETDSG